MYKKINLLKDLNISLSNFSLAIIYIIQKMLLLLRDHPNFLKAVFSNVFLRSIIDL